MGQRKNGQATEMRLLEAAEPLFASMGYDGVSLRTVAADAGAQLGAIPYHYGTKLALYRAIWEHWMPQISSDSLLQSIEIREDDGIEHKIARLVRALLNGPRILLASPRGRNFAAILVREANDPSSQARGLLEEFIYPNGNLIRDQLQQILPDLRHDRFVTGFKMTVAAIQVAFEGQPDSLDADDAATDAMLDDLTAFAVNGWIGLLGASRP